MFLDSKKPVVAKRVGRTLVATFRNSNPALVWTFDLERNHSFALALHGDEGDLELGVTSPKGEFYPVARFTAREDADLAFTAVQKILMNKRYGWAGGILKWTGALFLLLAAALMIAATVIYHDMHMAASGPEIKNGVPLPADQVLRPPN